MKRIRLLEESCAVTADGWCETHSDELGPIFCITDLSDLLREEEA